MRALDRKLVRDLWQMKGQAVAIGLVIASGVAVFVMSLCTLGTLRKTQEAYYERYRFADVFAHLKRAPNSLAERIAELPGVARVQTRVVVNVTLDVEGMAEPAVGRLVSVPDRQAPGLNGLYLRSGRYVEPGRDGEVLVSEGFATAHCLRPGDRVLAVINGRRQQLRIVGVALSPEYVYQIREGDVLPDDRRYGVFWMGDTELASAFDMRGAFNDVALTLGPGASEPEVLRRLDRLTEAYGGLGAFGRADQPSHKFVSNEINKLRGMAMVVPAIFLSVAAFLLNVVLSRLIGTQREQIAALKAFGYTRWEVALHYLKLVLLIVTAGGRPGRGGGGAARAGAGRVVHAFLPLPRLRVPPGRRRGAAGIPRQRCGGGRRHAGGPEPRGPPAPRRGHAPGAARGLPADASGVHGVPAPGPPARANDSEAARAPPAPLTPFLPRHRPGGRRPGPRVFLAGRPRLRHGVAV
jgi:putative ABC transport system permease protein